MPHGIRQICTLVLVLGIAVVTVPLVVRAQQGFRGPVARMFDEDQKKDASLAQSFVPADLPATASAKSPLRVYLSAGDLERAFDKREFRPDAAIIPTNTDLQLTASSPATQRVLMDRVQKQAEVMRDLDAQVAERRKQGPAPGPEKDLLR